MIKNINKTFYLITKETEYVIKITPGGLVQHLYYGALLNDFDTLAYEDKITFIPGNTVEYDDVNRKVSLEHFKSEFSENGKGDVREISLDLIHDDSSRSCDFVYFSHEISEQKYSLNGLPSSYGDEVSSLKLTLKDRHKEIYVDLLYAVFEECNVITRSVRITNKENNAVTIRKIMSSQIDFDEFDRMDFITFNGQWAYEMNMNRKPVTMGTMSGASCCLTSSNRVNPFCILCDHDADDFHGNAYGFNLIYSGNHYESVFMDAFNKIRFMQGINPSEFCYLLPSKESFDAPEAVLTYSENGLNSLSHNMHEFVREHIIRGEWKKKERPVLINSWESFYFDINERKLFDLAKNASKLGMELFVIDDGWFKGRNDDKTSLGDWVVDEKKFPHGMKAFGEKIKELGMDLGIWVEPEMISEESMLYKEHPDWAVRIPGRDHALGRNQMLLDLTRDEVCDYIVSAMDKVLSMADISYVKWDMNRVVSDAYSPSLIGRELEFSHRYILGLYKILDKIISKHPDVLFESCCSGGNRADLGMLCYMPQFWASDNTDAACRMKIQEGYSYGYPMSVLGAHVSQCPNHQTLRTTGLDTRFNVASFGILGYECNLSDFSAFECDQVKKQIEFYKKYRKVLQSGVFSRLKNDGNEVQWMCNDADSHTAIVLYYKKEVIPGEAYARIKTVDLAENMKYDFFNREVSFSIKDFGSLINTISPVHIKMNSLLHNVLDKLKHIDSEKERLQATGRVFNKAGVKVKEGFACRGFNENIRFMPDNGSRLYVFEGIKDNTEK